MRLPVHSNRITCDIVLVKSAFTFRQEHTVICLAKHCGRDFSLGISTASTTFACSKFALMFGDVGAASACWVVRVSSVEVVCQVEQCRH